MLSLFAGFEADRLTVLVTMVLPGPNLMWKGYLLKQRRAGNACGGILSLSGTDRMKDSSGIWVLPGYLWFLLKIQAREYGRFWKSEKCRLTSGIHGQYQDRCLRVRVLRLCSYNLSRDGIKLDSFPERLFCFLSAGRTAAVNMKSYTYLIDGKSSVSAK